MGAEAVVTIKLQCTAEEFWRKRKKERSFHETVGNGISLKRGKRAIIIRVFKQLFICCGGADTELPVFIQTTNINNFYKKSPKSQAQRELHVKNLLPVVVAAIKILNI